MNRKRILSAIVLVAAAAVVLWLAPWSRLERAQAQSATNNPKQERKVLYWVDPMHPQYKSNKPGTAPDCGMDLVPVYEGADATESMPAGTVKIDAAKQQLIGVTYGVAGEEPLARTLRAVGKVAMDETRITHVHTKIEGWIERVQVDFTGKLVRQGEPLLSIYSPELLSAQQELLIAKRGLEYAAGSSDPQFQRNARSLYDSARERLRLWDMEEAQIVALERTGQPQKAVTIYAPATGFVLTRNAFEHQRVMPDSDLYSVADLSTVWVIADVYENEAAQVREGQEATVTLSYLPGKKYRGRVAYIYPQVDPMTRTLKVRVEVANPGYELKPEMFANVELRSDFGRHISVPQEAVLDSGDEQIVFVAHDGGYFEPRHVQLGGKVGDRYVVLSGLKTGERIVTSGNFLIDSESRLKSATSVMASPHAGHGAPAATTSPKSGSPVPHTTPQPARPKPAAKSKPPAGATAREHSQHTAPAAAGRSQPSVVDHSQHAAPAADHSQHAGMDHSQHEPAQPAQPAQEASPDRR